MHPADPYDGTGEPVGVPAPGGTKPVPRISMSSPVRIGAARSPSSRDRTTERMTGRPPAVDLPRQVRSPGERDQDRHTPMGRRGSWPGRPASRTSGERHHDRVHQQRTAHPGSCPGPRRPPADRRPAAGRRGPSAPAPPGPARTPDRTPARPPRSRRASTVNSARRAVEFHDPTTQLRAARRAAPADRQLHGRHQDGVQRQRPPSQPRPYARWTAGRPHRSAAPAPRRARVPPGRHRQPQRRHDGRDQPRRTRHRPAAPRWRSAPARCSSAATGPHTTSRVRRRTTASQATPSAAHAVGQSPCGQRRVHRTPTDGPRRRNGRARPARPARRRSPRAARRTRRPPAGAPRGRRAGTARTGTRHPSPRSAPPPGSPVPATLPAASTDTSATAPPLLVANFSAVQRELCPT